MLSSFIDTESNMDFLNMLDIISSNPNINIKSLGLTEEQSIGIYRPLPDLNPHINIDLFKKRIETLKRCKWFNFKGKKDLKILNKIYATKEK